MFDSSSWLSFLDARRGEELFKRTCTFEGPRPAVDLDNNPAVLKDLFTLFLGTSGPGPSLDASKKPGQRAEPASAAVRSRILALLCRSIPAAGMFPQTLLVIEQAVYGVTSGMQAVVDVM